MTSPLEPVAMDMTGEFVAKRNTNSSVKDRMENWTPKPVSIDDIENRIMVANSRREEFVEAKKKSAKSASTKNLSTKEQLQAEEQAREETRQKLLKKQQEAEARAQQVLSEVQSKASRMAFPERVQENRIAMKISEETSTKYTKELNEKRHAEAEARAAAALEQTASKGARMSSPTKKREELVEKDDQAREEARQKLLKKQQEAEARAQQVLSEVQSKASRMAFPERVQENRIAMKISEETNTEALRKSLDKRLAEAEARVEAIRNETVSKAASMSIRVKVSSATQADATPIATSDKTVEVTSDGQEITANTEQATTESCGVSKVNLDIDEPMETTKLKNKNDALPNVGLDQCDVVPPLPPTAAEELREDPHEDTGPKSSCVTQ